MTDEEALVVHYLRAYAGQRVSYCVMLNFLSDQMVGRFPASYKEQRLAWTALSQAVNSLVKKGIVIRHRTTKYGRRHQTARLNEAFV